MELKKQVDLTAFNNLSMEARLNDIPNYSLTAKYKLVEYLKKEFNHKLDHIKKSVTYDDIRKIKEIKLLKTNNTYVQMLKKMKFDLAYFAGVTMQHKFYSIPEFHKSIYKDYDKLTHDEIFKYLGIIIYRDSAKSTTKILYCLRSGCYKLDDVIAFISEAEDQSIRDIITIWYEFEENEMILLIFENMLGGIKNKTEIELKNGMYIVAKGLKSKSRGIKHKGNRPTSVFLDDFESEDNSGSEGQRKEVREKITRQIIPMGKDMNIIFIGTMIHPDAYLGKIQGMSMFTGATGIVRKYEAWSHDEDGNRVSSWEDRFPLSYFDMKLKMYQDNDDEAGYWQEYHNIPASESKPTFNLELIRFVRGVYHNLEGLNYIEYWHEGKPVSRVNIKLYNSIDPAFGRKTTNDESVYSAVCETPDRQYGILYNYGCRVQASKQVDEVINTYKKYKSDLFLIESNGAQLGLYNFIQERIQQTGIYMPISKFDKRKSKDKKFKEGLTPLINDARVFILIPPDAEFDREVFMNDVKNEKTQIKNLHPHLYQIRLLLRQMRSFTNNDEDRDDRIDSVYMCAVRLGHPPYKIDVDAQIRKIQVEKMMLTYNKFGQDPDDSFEDSWRNAF